MQNSAWAYAYRRNATSGVGYDTYSADDLRGRTCLDTPDEAEGVLPSWNELACDQQSTWWSSFDCAEAELHGFGYAEVQKCRDVACTRTSLARSRRAAGLLFALMGCLSRVCKRADSNFQKIICCVPDTYGFVCLAITLSAFYVDCYDHLPEHIDGMRMHYFPGPGYVAYFLCWLATGVRVTMHWLVPVPAAARAAARSRYPRCAWPARREGERQGARRPNGRGRRGHGAGRGPVGVRRRHRRRGHRAGRKRIR